MYIQNKFEERTVSVPITGIRLKVAAAHAHHSPLGPERAMSKVTASNRLIRGVAIVVGILSTSFTISNLSSASSQTAQSFALPLSSEPQPATASSALPFIVFGNAVAAPLRVGFMGGFIASNPITDLVYACIDGARVAAFEANSKTGGVEGRKIEILEFNTGDVSLRVPDMMDEIMANASTRLDVMALMPGRNHINRVIEPLAKYNLMMMGPVAGDRVDFEKYNKHLALVSPVPDVEIEALIRYLVLDRNIKRIAVCTTYGEVYGNEQLPLIRKLLEEFGLTINNHFVSEQAGNPIPNSEGSDVSKLAAAYSQPFEKRPQALLMLGGLYVESGNFIHYYMQFFGTTIVATPGLIYLLAMKALAAFDGFGMPRPPIEIVTTQYTPLSTDARWRVVRRMRENFNLAYMSEAAGHPDFVTLRKPLAYYDAYSMFSPHLTAGYVVMRFLIAAMRNIGANGITSEAIMNETFSQKIFMIDDWAYGPLSMPCPEGDTLRTVPCGCNSAARLVLVSKMNANYQLEPLPKSQVTFSLDTCLPTNHIQSPLIQLIATPTANFATPGEKWINSDQLSHATAISEQFTQGDSAGYVNLSTSPSSRKGIKISFVYDSFLALSEKERDSLLTIATGSTFAQPLTRANSDNITAVLDPLFTVPMLYSQTGYIENVIYLSPTLEQEIHSLVGYFMSGLKFGSEPVNAMTTVVDDAGFIEGFSDACARSANTFGGDFGAFVAVSSIVQGLASAGPGNWLVHGIQTTADIIAIRDYLARHTNANVLIPSHHIVLWYDTIISTIVSDSQRARVIFATNLPNWNVKSANASTVSPLMKGYYDVTAEQSIAPSPQTLRGYIAQRLVANIVERIPSKLTQSSFLATLYAVSVVVLDANDYSIGPLSNVACANGNGGAAPSSASSGGVCEINVGARQVSVRSLLGVTADPASVAESLKDRVGSSLDQQFFSSGRIDYRALPSESSQTTLIVVVVVVASTVLVLIIFLLVIYLCFSGRSHSNAPKDSTKPFTLVFTDIQSSTSLWAEVPDDMAKAIDVHHALIRSLIKEHRGYEVKTIGDSFMIAFNSADDAVKLAYDLQHDFYNCKEFPASIDHAYLAFDREKMMDANDDFMGSESGDNHDGSVSEDLNGTINKTGAGAYQHATNSRVYIRTASTLHLRNLTAYLNPEDYNRMWHGIRVRIGINTNYGDVKRDEVTLAYDYYGTVTNTAARVEAVAHGGQVLMTKDTHSHLTALTIAVHDVVIPDEDRMACTAASGPRVCLKMGSVELRGLVDKVELYQLECVPGREFPPLRLERADDDLDEELKEGKTETTDTIPQGFLHSEGANTTQQNSIHPFATPLPASVGVSAGVGAQQNANNGQPSPAVPAFFISTASTPSQSTSPREVAIGGSNSNAGGPATTNNNTMTTSGTTTNAPNQQQPAAPQLLPAIGISITPNQQQPQQAAAPPPLRLGGLLGVDTRSEGGGASMLSFRAGGVKGGGNAGNVNEIHGTQFMAAIATLFSIIPAEKRGKELKRICDLWRIRVDEKKLQKKASDKKIGSGAMLGATPQANAKLGVGNNNMMNDRMSHRPSDHASEPFARLTGQLTGGDGLTALCLEALAKRLKNVAGKKLATAVNNCGGINAVNGATGAAANNNINLVNGTIVGGPTATYGNTLTIGKGFTGANNAHSTPLNNSNIAGGTPHAANANVPAIVFGRTASNMRSLSPRPQSIKSARTDQSNNTNNNIATANNTSAHTTGGGGAFTWQSANNPTAGGGGGGTAHRFGRDGNNDHRRTSVTTGNGLESTSNSLYGGGERGGGGGGAYTRLDSSRSVGRANVVVIKESNAEMEEGAHHQRITASSPTNAKGPANIAFFTSTSSTHNSSCADRDAGPIILTVPPADGVVGDGADVSTFGRHESNAGSAAGITFEIPAISVAAEEEELAANRSGAEGVGEITINVPQ